MSDKADEVIKKRRKEYIRDTFILFTVLIVVVTGIALAIKFLKKEPTKIVLYSETGEIIGTYSESDSVNVPSKTGYESSWVTESGKVYNTIDAALSNGETSITQVFTPIEYTVTLYLTGGTAIKDFGFEYHAADKDQKELGDYYTKTYTVEDESFDLPLAKTNVVATKHGCKFEFWSSVNYIGKNFSIDSLKATETKTIDTSTAQDIVLYAAWREIPCTIGVVGFEGDVLFFDTYTVITLLSEDELTERVLPYTPTDYVFIGFYADKDLKIPFDFSKELGQEQVTIYTKWHSPEFTLTFMDLNEDVLSSATYRAKDTITFYDYTDKLTPGKLFDCWMLDGKPFTSTTMPADDITLYPGLINIPYTITWIVNDNLQDTTTCYYGDTPEAPSTLDTSKEEDEAYTYEFSGWSPTIVAVDDDATYTAQYTPTLKQFTYSIKANKTTLVNDTTVDYGTSIVFPENPEQYNYMEGHYEYVFDKWVIKDTDTTPTTVTQDMVIVASYTQLPRPYTVTWYDKDNNIIQVNNGTELVDSLTVRYNEEVDVSLALPNTPASYIEKINNRDRLFSFNGWEIDGNLYTASTYKVTGDTAISARYFDDNRKVSYTLVYEDGTGYYGFKDGSYYVGNEGDSCNESDADLAYANIIAFTPSKAADETYTYTFEDWYFGENYDTKLESYTQLPTEPTVENLLLYAKYTKTYIDYTINFVDYDGTEISKKTDYHYGNTVTVPDDPTRDADNTYKYTFAGWDSAVVDVDGSKTYTATYDREFIEYTVKFVDYNGTEISSATYHFSDAVVLPDDPTRAADKTYTYEFAFWSPAVTAVSESTTYTAVYTGTYIEYTITFKNYDGSIILSKDYHYGDEVELPENNPTKPADNTYTYTFAGWSPTVIDVDGEAIYTAQYTPEYREYTVAFVDYDDSEISSDTYHYGAEVNVPADPTRDADNTFTYSFAGWNNEVVNVAGDATYKATYTSIYRNYTITFVNYDGTEISKVTTYHYNDTVTAPSENPTKASTVEHTYAFNGWSPAVTAVSGDATYTAQYTENARQYTYTFYLEDKTTVFYSDTVDYGTKVHKPTTNPTTQADATYTYDFAKWTTFDGTDYVDEQDLVGDVSYMATFTPDYIIYVVTFNDHNGTEITKNNYHYGDPVTTPTDPTRDADETWTYEFAGWDSEVVNVVGDATYTATYTSTYIDYKITWVLDNGEDPIVVTYHYNDPVTAPDEPTKAADNTYTYAFKDWGEEIVACKGNKTYTAQYTASYINYTVKFVDYDETEISSAIYRFGDDVVVPANPTRAADKTYTYAFKDWGETVVACNGNKTYTATYTPSYIEYTITWVLNNGDGPIVDTYHYDDPVPAPTNPTKQYYTFTGWDKVIPTKMADEDITITAQWTLTKYYVFAYIGNTKVDTFEFDIEHDVDFSDYVNAAYDFGGWYEEDVSNSEITSFTPISSYGHTSGDICVYGVIKTKGLTIVNNEVTGYVNGATRASNVVIPRIWKTEDTIYTITTIHADAFKNDAAIQSIEMPFITTIQSGAFQYCDQLTAINLSKITTIGDEAFAGCEGLTSINLSSATSIGSNAFAWTSITEITLSSNLVTLGDYAFRKCDISVIYYDGSKDAFETLVNSTSGNTNLLNKIPD